MGGDKGVVTKGAAEFYDQKSFGNMIAAGFLLNNPDVPEANGLLATDKDPDFFPPLLHN
jgi:hypothetical protein